MEELVEVELKEVEGVDGGLAGGVGEKVKVEMEEFEVEV